MALGGSSGGRTPRSPDIFQGAGSNRQLFSPVARSGPLAAGPDRGSEAQTRSGGRAAVEAGVAGGRPHRDWNAVSGAKCVEPRVTPAPGSDLDSLVGAPQYFDR